MVVTDEDHVLGVLLDRLAPLTARTSENLEKIRRIAHKINVRVNNTGKVIRDRIRAEMFFVCNASKTAI